MTDTMETTIGKLSDIMSEYWFKNDFNRYYDEDDAMELIGDEPGAGFIIKDVLDGDIGSDPDVDTWLVIIKQEETGDLFAYDPRYIGPNPIPVREVEDPIGIIKESLYAPVRYDDVIGIDHINYESVLMLPIIRKQCHDMRDDGSLR